MLPLLFSLSLAAHANEALIAPATKYLSESQVNWTKMRLEARNAYSSDTSSEEN